MKVVAFLLASLLASCVQPKPVMVTPVYEAVRGSSPNSVDNENKFYVNIKLVFFIEQVEKYPVTWQEFNNALTEWSSKVPVRWLMLPGGTPMYFENDHDAIQIHIADLERVPYGKHEKTMGLWQPTFSRLLLNSKHLEKNKDRAYNVGLHELGHLLGVPHVVNFSEMSYTGTVVLPFGEDAQDYVMYPTSTNELKRKTLSDLEVDFAKNTLLHYWTNFSLRYQLCKK